MTTQQSGFATTLLDIVEPSTVTCVVGAAAQCSGEQR
jgi:hypothetical protein